jgi:peptidyl-prolyl cis-trans isomerase SurA
MKPRTTIALALFLLAGAGALCAQQVVEEIVAVVNDDVISLSQYRERYDLMLRTLQAQLQGAELEKQVDFLKKNLLDTMISELLLLQIAKEKQLDVREQVKVYVENVKKQNNLETDEDLKAALAREGLQYDAWLKQTEDDILRQLVIYNEVDSHIVIDDNATMAYYKANAAQFVIPAEFHLQAIVLPLEAGAEEAIEARKKEISDKLAAGADFSALAEEFDPAGLKESKGDLGTMKKTELEPTLAEAADKLKPGEVSPWFEMRKAWYLIKLESRTESRQPSFEEVKRDVELRLSQEKKAKALQEFFEKLRAKNYIKILRPDPLGS